MDLATDPYEQKLFHMFSSHDVESNGSLDRTALLKLCMTLELKDRSQPLVRCLLKDDKTRITFADFKAGLLKFLGNEMVINNAHDYSAAAAFTDDENDDQCGTVLNTSDTTNNDSSSMATASTSPTPAAVNTATGVESPVREVSPKLIVGGKKYGRRSRPPNTAITMMDSSLSDSDNESVAVVPSISIKHNSNGKTSQKVQRSASQSDLHGAKRRRPGHGTKLKRCASLPARKTKKDESTAPASSLLQTQLESSVESLGNLDFENLSQSLYDAWSRVGSADTTTLNRKQLIAVCEQVGLDRIAVKVAEEVFEKLNLAPDQGIAFGDFIVLIQTDSDREVANHPAEISNYRHYQETNIKSDELINDDCASAPAGWTNDSNLVTADVITEMWESAGIVHANNLLINLGFSGEQISISQLSCALEDEMQGLHGEKTMTPLLRASLALRKAEVNALQQALRQFSDENRQLHSDNRDVNRRAAMLAQEVDERHASIENSMRSEIRHLEQRHAEIVRDLASKLASDRENWSTLNGRLEIQLKTLEADDARTKIDFSNARDEKRALEIEQIAMQKQMSDLLETNIKQNNEIVRLEEQCSNNEGSSSRRESEEVLELIEKITNLQIENTNLRDKTDELSAEIDNLSIELTKFKARKQSPRLFALNNSVNDAAGVVTAQPLEGNTVLATDDVTGSLLLAIKRRGDSPSKTRIPEESPRLGKLRKCNNDTNSGESETSGDWVALNSELGQTAPTTSGFSQDSSIGTSTDTRDDEIKQLNAKIDELQDEIEQCRALEVKEEELSIVKAENEALKSHCTEMETSLEQMRKEFDDLEDYWQAKLTEERQLYEEEQRSSDEKFNELFKKMSEYEEQFLSSEKNGRLTPIEEKCQLEQQYSELENELTMIKMNSQEIVDEKSKEIDKLQADLRLLNNQLNEAMLQSPPLPRPAQVDSPASSPINYLWHQSTIQAPARDYHNPNWGQHPQRITNGSQMKLTTSATTIVSTTDPVWTSCSSGADQESIVACIIPRTISPIQKPPTPKTKMLDAGDVDGADVISVQSGRSGETHSVASTHSVHKSLPGSICPSPTNIKEDVKRLKFMENGLREEIKELAYQRDCLIMELQQLQEAKPVLERTYARTVHPSLTTRILQLEQKNKHLQNVLRQQNHYTETIVHQTWQQQRVEISDLRSRLEAQSIIITEQSQRLTNADLLVKDLYVENSHLTATIQRMEQQRSRAVLFPHQGLSGVPGMP